MPPKTARIFCVTIPAHYREWQIIAPSHEEGFGELRVILGNPIAMKAYRKDTLPFPDGTVLAKIAWERMPSTELKGAFVPGKAKTTQIMVKDSKKYAATGGWGFGRFWTANLSTKPSTKPASPATRRM